MIKITTQEMEPNRIACRDHNTAWPNFDVKIHGDTWFKHLLFVMAVPWAIGEALSGVKFSV
jgi:hypothetical protein